MNAIPMLIRCYTHQPLWELFNRCDCGEPISGSFWQCATCALLAEYRALEPAA